MTTEDQVTIDVVNQALEEFAQQCPQEIEWEAHPIIAPANPGENSPEIDGISIVVYAEKLRQFDPLDGTWSPLDAKLLVFTIREANLLNVVLPGAEPESMVEKPLLRFENISEVPGCVALHVSDVFERARDFEDCDPIDEILLPLPQFPDDESDCLHNYPYVAVKHLTGLLEEHCQKRCPWLVAIDWEECEKAEALAKENSWNPSASEECRRSAEDALYYLKKIKDLRVTVRDAAKETASRLKDPDFDRALDPTRCLEMKIPLFAVGEDEAEIYYPFLVRFNRPVFLPFCSQEVSPNLSLYLFNRVLLETDLSRDLWPLEESKSETHANLPRTVPFPCFADQVQWFFEVRSLQLHLQTTVSEILSGEVVEPLRPARARIASLRKTARHLQEMVDAGFKYECEWKGKS